MHVFWIALILAIASFGLRGFKQGIDILHAHDRRHR